MNDTACNNATQHKKPIVWWCFLISVALLMLGGAALGSSEFDAAFGEKLLQLAALVIGAAVICVASRLIMLCSFAQKRPWLCYLVLVVAAAVYAVFARSEGSHTDWVFFILAAAYALMISAMRRKGTFGILVCFAASVPAIAVALYTYSMMGVVVVAVSVAVVTLAACASGWFGGQKGTAILTAVGVLLAAVLVLGIVLMKDSFFFGRQLAKLDPYSDPNGKGRITIVTREVLGSTNFLGSADVGSEAGNIPALFLQKGEERILTFVAYRFGWSVMAAVIALFAVAAVCGFALCRKKYGLARYVSIGAMTALTVQTALYISQNLGLDLVAVRALPFVNGNLLPELANLLLAALVLTCGAKPEPCEMTADSSDSCREPEPTKNFFERIRGWFLLEEPELPEEDKAERGDDCLKTKARIMVWKLALPDSADAVKRLFCFGDSEHDIKEATIDELLTDANVCHLYVYSGSLTELSDDLALLKISDKRVCFQLIHSSRLDPDTAASAATAVAAACPGDANITWGMCADDKADAETLRVVIATV